MADTTARIKLALEGAAVVEQGLASVEKRIGTVGKALLGLAGGVSLAGFAAFVKGGIDAADSMSKLSQKAGVAVKDVAGLELAFRQSGLEAGDLQANLGKLNKNIADGSKAFDSMGLSTKNADGTLKSARQVLGEVADKFTQYEDGAGKARLAQELFGKSGADMIPLLNGGAQALDEFDAMAKKLGLTLDEDTAKKAEQFSDTIDLMGLGLQGVSRQVAAELLPTLSGLAGQFFDNMTKGDKLKKTADFLSAGLKGLYVVALGVVEVFSTVGKTLGGVSAAIVAALTGDFSGAANILRDMKGDIGAGWKDTLAQMSAAWAATGSASVEAMASTQAALRVTAPELAKTGGAVKSVVDEFARLREKLTAKDAGTDADFLQNLQVLKAALDGGRISMAEYLRLSQLYVDAQPYMVAQSKAAADAVKAQADAEAARIKVFTDSATSASQRLTDMKAEAAAMAYAESHHVSLAVAIEETAVARLREAQAAEMAKGSGMNDSVVLALQSEIDTRRQLINAIASNDVRDAAKKLRDDQASEWAKTWDQVGKSFTDALMQGGRSVKQYLKDLFRTLVLRPILAPVGGAMASLLGGPASAGQGGGIGSLLSGASSLNSMWGALSGSINTLGSTTIANGVGAMGGDALGTLANLQGGGSSAMAGLGTAANAMGGALVGFMAGKMISGGYSAIGKSGNTAVVAGTAIGMAVGGPIGAAIGGALGGAVNRLFGRKLKDSGITGEFGGDAGFSGSQYQFFKGGLFRSDKTKTSALDDELRTALASQYELLADNTSGMAGQLKLSASALETYTRKVKFSTKGLTQDQITQRITEEFEAMGEEMAQLVLGTTEYTRTGEAASATLLRLSSSLTAANGMLDVLGTALFSVGLKGADMASHLVDQFGGLDAMVQASAAYYQAFYSETERADTATRLLTERMSGLGVSLPATTSEFRALVDGLDLTTESGRKTYAELLKLSPEFAALQAELQRLAEQTAAKLIATFTARGQLVPVLGDLSGALVRVTGEAGAFAGPVSTIHRLLGDAASGTLTFGDRLTSTSSALTMSQAATAGLQTQILALRTATSGAVVDMQGLSAALRDVDTLTFVETVVGVFELIGQRIKNTLGQIADERVAAREAAMGIINPGTMSAAQIRQQIAGTALKLPTTDGIEAAQRALAAADAAVSLQSRSLNATREWAERSSRAVADASANLSARQNLEQLARNATGNWNNDGSFRKIFGWAGVTGPGNLDGLTGMQLTDFIDRLVNIDPNTVAFSSKGRRGWDSVRNPYLEARNQANSTVKGNDAGWLSYVLSIEQAKQREANAALAQQQQALTKATTAQAAAAQQAQQAQLDYVASLQAYSVNAAKAVTQLGRLRGETVKYYEAQQQLAGLMTGTATGLRDAVAQYHFDQMDPAAQLANLQDRFNVAYSMALSTSGETLAGYGAELTQLLNPLLAKAQEAGLSGTQYSGLVSTILARAEAVAQRLDKLAPQGYEQESLSLLGQIDSTLAALEAGTKSADQLIVDAVNAGRDTTRDGLRAVVAALTGQAVPAFAMGGMHAGGVRLVGENGPELEVTGPARIYSAAQTRGMLGGADTGALVQEIRALRVEVGALRADNKVLQTQIMTNTGKTARQLDRWDGEGLPVKNLDGETLAVKSA